MAVEAHLRETGKEYYTLIPDYTDDGGHLNDLGKEIIAEKLLLFLVNLL